MITTHTSRRRDSTTALRFDNLGKQYSNGTWGLRHASAILESGKLIAVLGPNGAGKSTLIHMLAGAVHPSEGTIILGAPHTRVGWSSQRSTIDWYLNVIQNVMLGARLYGMSRKESQEQSQRMLEALHLADLASKDVSMLSGGQQQRIQVARTLVSDPDILLLDEPTASLDVEAAESVLRHIRERVRNGAIALISSHDLGLLERFCDEVIFIHTGSLIAHQTLPTFLRAFTPADELTIQVDGQLTSDHLRRLAHLRPRVEKDNLMVTMAEGASLAEIIATLEPGVSVLSATREPTSLRNVYLHMTRERGGRA